MAVPASSRPLIITADDTTGALESAAGLADLGRAATVVPLSLLADTAVADDGGPVVVDLRSRHLSAPMAAMRMAGVLVEAPHVSAHKIDSTLRGNWPAEVGAALAAGRRVLMVPAYPRAGRVCRGGVVCEHGVPVDRSDHKRDVRAPVLTSRPASLLPDADELRTAAEVTQWLAGNGRVAVADATDDQQITEIVGLACLADEVMLVGTAAVMAAVGACLGTARPRPPIGAPATLSVATPVLVVCGSLHPTSRAQIQALLRDGAVMVDDQSPAPMAPVAVALPSADRHDDPQRVAADLATSAHRWLHTMQTATVVLVGGDTAEAFIGDRVVPVTGSMGVGVALGWIDIDGRRIVLLAKPGAFGDANTLVDLMADVLHRSNAHG